MHMLCYANRTYKHRMLKSWRVLLKMNQNAVLLFDAVLFR